jgi:hypothetical protein
VGGKKKSGKRPPAGSAWPPRHAHSLASLDAGVPRCWFGCHVRSHCSTRSDWCYHTVGMRAVLVAGLNRRKSRHLSPRHSIASYHTARDLAITPRIFPAVAPLPGFRPIFGMHTFSTATTARQWHDDGCCRSGTTTTGRRRNPPPPPPRTTATATKVGKPSHLDTSNGVGNGVGNSHTGCQVRPKKISLSFFKKLSF